MGRTYDFNVESERRRGPDNNRRHARRDSDFDRDDEPRDTDRRTNLANDSMVDRDAPDPDRPKQRRRGMSSGWGEGGQEEAPESPFQERLEEILNEFDTDALTGSKVSLKAMIESLVELYGIADKAFRSNPTQGNSNSVNNIASQLRAAQEELRALEDEGRIKEIVEKAFDNVLDGIARKVGNEMIDLRDKLDSRDASIIKECRGRLLEAVAEGRKQASSQIENL